MTAPFGTPEFENDVKEYGIQTIARQSVVLIRFENDVKEYGIQTHHPRTAYGWKFENDVKEYGIQTFIKPPLSTCCLRMM